MKNKEIIHDLKCQIPYFFNDFSPLSNLHFFDGMVVFDFKWGIQWYGWWRLNVMWRESVEGMLEVEKRGGKKKPLKQCFSQRSILFFFCLLCVLFLHSWVPDTIEPDLHTYIICEKHDITSIWDNLSLSSTTLDFMFIFFTRKQKRKPDRDETRSLSLSPNTLSSTLLWSWISICFCFSPFIAYLY